MNKRTLSKQRRQRVGFSIRVAKQMYLFTWQVSNHIFTCRNISLVPEICWKRGENRKGLKTSRNMQQTILPWTTMRVTLWPCEQQWNSVSCFCSTKNSWYFTQHFLIEALKWVFRGRWVISIFISVLSDFDKRICYYYS